MFEGTCLPGVKFKGRHIQAGVRDWRQVEGGTRDRRVEKAERESVEGMCCTGMSI